MHLQVNPYVLRHAENSPCVGRKLVGKKTMAIGEKQGTGRQDVVTLLWLLRANKGVINLFCPGGLS